MRSPETLGAQLNCMIEVRNVRDLLPTPGTIGIMHLQITLILIKSYKNDYCAILDMTKCNFAKLSTFRKPEY
jgi:hypothetical protein